MYVDIVLTLILFFVVLIWWNVAAADRDYPRSKRHR
jgi:hypothetical protein